MKSVAVLLEGPERLGLETLEVIDPGAGDIVVDVTHSGISTGTEKLLWSGEMPPFPGLGYPLVPGYESTGVVADAGPETGFTPGDRVFVPGADCYRDARGLFGGAASRLVTKASRACRIDPAMGATGALLALAATAYHAIAHPKADAPDLIVGHGVLGRLIARQTIAAGHPAPMVWDTNADRRHGADGYDVCDPGADPRRDYAAIYDASGDAALLDTLIGRIAKDGEITLAGFYAQPVSFAFPPAFMKEARLRIAAEWATSDLIATRALVEAGTLSLGGLITHIAPASDAATAYPTAFGDPGCLKMILDWTAIPS